MGSLNRLAMTIRLRPHHLLCMLTYVGKGYSPAFVATYDALVERIGRGEPLTIVAGPDDICAPLAVDCGAHCHRASVTRRDRQAAHDVGVHLGMDIEPDATLRLDTERLSSLRAAFWTGRIRAACTGCEWTDLCTSVADDGYRGVRLRA